MQASDVAGLCTKNNRICPMPSHSQNLYNLLSDKERKGMGWNPPVPMILAAWHEASDSSKAMRLKEHIDWAFTHGNGDQIVAFLVSLKEEDWYHKDE